MVSVDVELREALKCIGSWASTPTIVVGLKAIVSCHILWFDCLPSASLGTLSKCPRARDCCTINNWLKLTESERLFNIVTAVNAFMCHCVGVVIHAATLYMVLSKSA
eukprot:4317399-Amphidinium_carterae.1